MLVFSRKVDQWIMIGRRLMIGPTDIDAGGVRLHVRGELIGGPDDGSAIDRTVELGVGSNIRLGSLVTVTLAEVESSAGGLTAHLAIVAPPHTLVERREVIDVRPGPDQA